MLKYILLNAYYCLTILVLYGCFEKDREDFRTKMLVEVNKQRLSGCFCGEDSMPPVRELKYDVSLEIAARRHVIDMAENEFLDHIGTDGSTPQNRASDAGFNGAYIGENIARGFVTVDDVLARWLNSEEHCKTIMAPYFSYVGVAYENYYWVQLFGSEN